MDLKIHRPTCRCASTGRAIAAGEDFYSALVRTAAGITRIDVAPEAWSMPPDNAIAWWKSTLPLQPTGPTLASPDVLLDLLERLDGTAEEESLRYLLALFLARRRILKLCEGREPEGHEPRVLRFTCRRRATEYVVRPTAPDAASIEPRLTALLWSGEAA